MELRKFLDTLEAWKNGAYSFHIHDEPCHEFDK